MNLNNPDIKEYLEKLPPAVQKSIKSSEWKQKILDIGNKYSLQPDQIDNLEVEALLVAIGVESDEEMILNIERELDISEVLAEQLTEDVNQRVYKWIYKQLSSEPTLQEKVPEPNIPEKEPEHANTLDVPPANLPGEVIEDEIKVKPVAIQDQVKDFFAPGPTIVSETAGAPFVPSSPIHPIEAPIEEPVPQKPQSFIAQKLAQPTAPQKYSADPYREPIE